MNIDHKTGGPAFPFKVLLNNGDGTETEHIFSGMTLRDYFAGIALPRALAMAGRIREIADGDPLAKQPERYVAAAAYKMADAMLEARKV